MFLHILQNLPLMKQTLSTSFGVSLLRLSAQSTGTLSKVSRGQVPVQSKISHPFLSSLYKVLGSCSFLCDFKLCRPDVCTLAGLFQKQDSIADDDFESWLIPVSTLDNGPAQMKTTGPMSAFMGMFCNLQCLWVRSTCY